MFIINKCLSKIQIIRDLMLRNVFTYRVHYHVLGGSEKVFRIRM